MKNFVRLFLVGLFLMSALVLVPGKGNVRHAEGASIYVTVTPAFTVGTPVGTVIPSQVKQATGCYNGYTYPCTIVDSRISASSVIVDAYAPLATETVIPGGTIINLATPGVAILTRQTAAAGTGRCFIAF